MHRKVATSFSTPKISITQLTATNRLVQNTNYQYQYYTPETANLTPYHQSPPLAPSSKSSNPREKHNNGKRQRRRKIFEERSSHQEPSSAQLQLTGSEYYTSRLPPNSPPNSSLHPWQSAASLHPS
jgi:hypothetical protein